MGKPSFHWMAFDEAGELAHEGNAYEVALALGVSVSSVYSGYYRGRTCAGHTIDTRETPGGEIGLVNPHTRERMQKYYALNKERLNKYRAEYEREKIKDPEYRKKKREYNTKYVARRRAERRAENE